MLWIRIWNNKFGNLLTGIAVRLKKQSIARNLAENPVWKNKYKELMSVHELLQKEELEMPSCVLPKT